MEMKSCENLLVQALLTVYILVLAKTFICLRSHPMYNLFVVEDCIDFVRKTMILHKKSKEWSKPLLMEIEVEVRD